MSIHRDQRRLVQITPFPLVVSVLGVLALLTPLGDAEEPMHRVGALLVAGGALAVLHGIRRADSGALRRAVAAGVISILMGMLVLMAPYTTALVPLLALAFALDGLGYFAQARRSIGRQRVVAGIAAWADVITAVGLLVIQEGAGAWLVAVAAALRLFGIAWSMAVTPVHSVEDAAVTVIEDLGWAIIPRLLNYSRRSRATSACEPRLIADGPSPSSSRSLPSTAPVSKPTARCLDMRPQPSP